MKKIIKKLLTALSLFLITSLYIPSAFGIINPSVLKQAYKIFSYTPGAKTVFKKIKSSSHDCHSTKGYEYEIKTAVKIKNKKEEKIIEFGCRLKCPKSRKVREIDIRTDKRFIECKNINWKKTNVKKLKKQFCDQRDLTDFYNKINKTNIFYVVCSNNPIPAQWKKWFDRENIAFEETDKDY